MKTNLLEKIGDIVLQISGNEENYCWAMRWIKKDIKKLLKQQKKEIISQVCMEIASFSPLSIEKSEKLLKIIRKI